MRRYEVQVRLSNDGSSVYLYPDQLNVLGPNPKPIQQQPQVAIQRPLPPANEARTLDTGVVDAAVRYPVSIIFDLLFNVSQVRNIAAIVGRTCAEGGSCTLTQLHKVSLHVCGVCAIPHQRLQQANPAYRGGLSAFSHEDDARVALDALELLLRAHEHVFILRPLFDKGNPDAKQLLHPSLVLSMWLLPLKYFPFLQATFKCS